MNKAATSPQARIPSVDRVLRLPAIEALIEADGRPAVTDAVRAVHDRLRAAMGAGAALAVDEEAVAGQVAAALEDAARPTLRPVFNLTGTVLHTNLGRAPLPQAAIRASTAGSRNTRSTEGIRACRDVSALLMSGRS